MTHEIGTNPTAGRGPIGVRVRPHGADQRRRSAAVFVRIPRLDDRPPAPPERRTALHVPSTDRRFSVEQDLRRVRRESRQTAGHTLRNTTILIVLLLAAASLTVWATQGFDGPETLPGRLPAADGDSRLSDGGPPMDLPGDDSRENMAYSSWTPPWEGNASTAPSLRTWPPLATEEPAESPQDSAGEAGPLVGQASPVYDDSIGNSTATSATAMEVSSTDDAFAPEQYEGPVASLRPIEPVRR